MGSGTSSRKSSAMQTHPNQQQHLQQFQQGFQQHLQQQQQNQGQQNQGQQLQGQQFQGQQPQPTQQQYLQQQNFNGSNGEVPSNILAELKSSDNPSKQSVQNQGLQSQSGKNQGEIDPVFLMDSKVLNKLNVRQEKILFYIEKIQNAIQTDDYEAHDAIFAKYLADVFDDKIDKSDEFASKIDFKARPDVPIDSYKREQIANFKLEQLDSTAEEIEFIANHCNDMRAFADLIHRYNRTIKIVEAITVFSPKQPIGKCEQCMKRIAPLGFRVCQKCLARSVVTDQFENFIFDKKHVRALCVKRKSFLNTLDPYVCRQKCSYGFEVCDDCQSEMLEALTYETVPFNFGMNAAVCKSCKVFSPPFGFENCLRCQKEALGLIKKKHVKLECGPSSKRAGLYFCKGIGNGCNPKKLLWGNNPYVEGSSICLAALHGSAVNLNGGEFTVQMLENPPTKFPGSVKNDIVSLDYVGKQSAFQVFVAVDLVDFEKFKADLYVDHARKTSLIDGSSPIKSSNFKSDYYVDHAKRTSLIEDNPPVKAPDF